MGETPLLRLGVLLLVILAAIGIGTELLMRQVRGSGRASREADVRAETVARQPAAVAAVARQAAQACSVAAADLRLPDDVRESSGVAYSRRTPGLLWTHNDSGQPEVVGVDEQGAERARVRVTGATVTDWEDVSAGPCPGGSCLYVADIGDNRAARTSITIYRVPEPATDATATAPAEVFHATYPDHAQDAEAIFVLADGGLYVASKGETGPAALYRFPQPLRPGATVTLEKVAAISPATLARPERITGASASPDGRWVALRTLGTLSLYRTQNGAVNALTDPLVMNLKDVREEQGEGVALGDSGAVFLTSEAGKKKHATLSRLACTLPS